MSLPVKTGLPDGLEIGDKYVIRFDAVDPSTGATVAGVKVSQASILSASGAAVTLIPETLPELTFIAEEWQQQAVAIGSGLGGLIP